MNQNNIRATIVHYAPNNLCIKKLRRSSPKVGYSDCKGFRYISLESLFKMNVGENLWEKLKSMDKKKRNFSQKIP